MRPKSIIETEQQTRTRTAVVAVGFFVLLAVGIKIGISTFGRFGGPQTFIITNPNTVPPQPDLARPGYLATITDNTFSTRLTRITGDTGTAIPTIGGTWRADARHHYSKDQPWNADGSLLAIQNTGASPSQIYLDGNTYQPVKAKCANYSVGDDRWHPVPQYRNVRINANGTKLEWYDVVSCTQIRVWEPPNIPFAVNGLGDGEGNTSFDGRYVVLGMNQTTALGTPRIHRMFLVDMDPQPPHAPYPNKRVGPVYTFDACDLGPGCPQVFDWISVSPSGLYVVVSTEDHLRVFDIDQATLALTPRVFLPATPTCTGDNPATGSIVGLGHADLTRNPFDNNADVIIGQRRNFCDNLPNANLLGRVVMVKLVDGAVTSLTSPTNEAYAHHISARNIDRPGWVYVGYYDEPTKRFSDEIIALRMDGSQTVERLIQKRSAFAAADLNQATGCYRCESHPVPSRDGRRVLFASNWFKHCGAGCGLKTDIKAYVVDSQSVSGGGGRVKRTKTDL